MPPPAGVSGSQPSRSPNVASAYLPPMVNSEGSKSKLAGSRLVQGERAPGTSPGNPLRMTLQLLLSPSMMGGGGGGKQVWLLTHLWRRGGESHPPGPQTALVYGHLLSPLPLCAESFCKKAPSGASLAPVREGMRGCSSSSA